MLDELDLDLPPAAAKVNAGLTVAQLAGQLERMDPQAVVLLGNAPGPLAHLTETDTSVILDKCTHGTCCRVVP